MSQDMVDPYSFWDLAIPKEGGRAVVELYGKAAAAKAVQLVLDALRAGDDDNYRYWTAVYSRIFVSGFQQTEGSGQ